MHKYYKKKLEEKITDRASVRPSGVKNPGNPWENGLPGGFERKRTFEWQNPVKRNVEAA